MYKQRTPLKGRPILTYVLYVAVSISFTSALGFVQAIYVLKEALTPTILVIPITAGLVFGLMLARIKLLSSRLQEIAYTDSLTQTYNRLHMSHFLDAAIERARRYDVTFSLIMFDLDHFKKINDQYGHQTGDRILQQATNLVMQSNRDADILARYGGEEFLILASDTNINGAMKHAERLRRDLANYSFGLSQKVTASFGVAEFKPDTDTIDSLIRRTDIALYNAKAKGRNCVAQA